jgi:alginate O-acetyltransferase complex protein AlgI
LSGADTPRGDNPIQRSARGFSAWLIMVFTTYLFVFYFLPLVLVFYYGLIRLNRQAGASGQHTSFTLNALLVLASYIFYGWWNPWFIFLMLGITVVNYACGRIIGQAGLSLSLRRCVVASAIVVSLGTLGFFKYFLFFEDNLNQVLAWFGAGTMRVLAITLPIGISFYTFHALSYTIDVYRGTAPPVRSFIDFACYISLFPQLVAGPIIRYNTVAEQLGSRSHTPEKFASGVTLFILGFAKKILLANPMGRVADTAFDAQSLATPDAWFGTLAYAFQIYFDFSGYSDMAIGLGRMIGFEFLKNFDSPYQADSITDFWRRWHISLSTFLRDYLYIPLGGNRKGPLRTYANLILVMLLGGLWHGANWTFVVWGAYHGVLLASERFRGKRSGLERLPRPVRVAATFILVLFSWVLFRSANLNDAKNFLAVMFGQGHSGTGMLVMPALLYTQETLLIMAVGAVVVAWPTQAHEWSREVTWRKAILVHPLFCASLLAMFSQSFNPFLYFQF